MVWKWNWLKHEEEYQEDSTDEHAGTTDEDSDSGLVAEDDLPTPSHSLTFKCIGVTKNRDYQTTLRMVRDLIHAGQEVTVSLFHEVNNPRGARALAFVCQVESNAKPRIYNWVCLSVMYLRKSILPSIMEVLYL